MDGHAKKQNTGFLADGTNFHPGLDHGSLIVTDTSKYHWYVSP